MAREMRRIPRDEIPLEQLAKIANLSWRINHPSIGLRLLFPRLRAESNLKVTSALDAFTEYAGCLLEVGALSEAKQVLRDLKGRTPRSKFYSALLLFKEWDYEKAIPLLEEYLKEIPADYHRLVVRVNLASSYVNIRDWTQAKPFLKELQDELANKGHWLLLGNCYEIESQIHFEEREHARALECLAISEKHLGQSRNMGWLYCKKWQLLNRLYQAKADGAPLDGLDGELKRLKRDALAMGSWETLRELDLHWAVCTSDRALLSHVYFGSPSPAYREKIAELVTRECPALEIPEIYTWLGDALSGAPARVHDFKGILTEFKSQPKDRKNGQSFLLKRLFYVLCSDFYAPFRIGQLFSILFNGEFYDLETSPDRVFQLIKRLREWLENRALGCEITWGRRGYALHFNPGRGLQFEKSLFEQGLPKKTNIHYLFVRERFGTGEFSSSDLGGEMNCSVRTANRVLQELKSEGKVVSLGQGRQTRFKLVS